MTVPASPCVKRECGQTPNMTDDAGQDTPVMSLTVNGADLFVAGGPDDDTADDLTDTFDHLLDRFLDMRDAEAENGFGVQ